MYKRSRGVEQGTTSNKSSQWSERDSNFWISRFQVRRPNHSSTLPPFKQPIKSCITYISYRVCNFWLLFLQAIIRQAFYTSFSQVAGYVTILNRLRCVWAVLPQHLAGMCALRRCTQGSYKLYLFIAFYMSKEFTFR